jgi:hypothetical protein
MPHRIPSYSANEFFSGALQIGVFVSHVLFGVTTTQTYIYYSRFPDDSPKIKALVSTKPNQWEIRWLTVVRRSVSFGALPQT